MLLARCLTAFVVFAALGDFSVGQSALLGLRADELEAEHGLALVEVRAGDLAAARARLERASKSAGSGELAPRIAAELERVAAFERLREAHLDALIASGGKLAFVHEGKKVSAVVTSFDGERLALGENKAKLEHVAVAALDPFELARAMNAELAATPDGWARAYMYVLAGDKLAEKQLKGAAPELATLRADANAWYPRALRIGAAARALESLRAAGDPADAKAAVACLTAITELTKASDDLDLVKARAAPLRTLAGVALGHQFDPAKSTAMFAGKLELLPDGRVRIAYEFDKPGELEDFREDHAYLAASRRPTRKLDGVERKLEIAKGALLVRGDGCVRHRLAFEAPLVVRYDVTIAAGGAKSSDFFMLGVCDDRAESLVECQGFGSLAVNDRPTRLQKSSFIEGGVQFTAGAAVAVELKIDGATASSSMNGKPMRTLDVGPRKSGDVLLAFRAASPLAFGKLVIEGRPAPDALRALWVERELAALGL